MMETSSDLPIKPSEQVRSMHPKKFALWLFMVSVVMLFIAFSSAYIVKKGAGNWEYVRMPDAFLWTSVTIVLSSISMHWAYIAARRNNINQIKLGVILTSLLAIVFTLGQVLAAEQLVEANHHFVDNPAESFIYVFGGIHLAHLVGGVVFLLIVLVSAFKYQVHSKRLARIEMCTTYWHFLGGLWLYLYIFLIINN